MRKRFPTMVRVLLALSLVASLVAVTAAPVSAQTAVTLVGFTASPTTAGAEAQYVVAFTANTTLVATVDTITVQFPAGVTLPPTIKKEYVSVVSTATSGPCAVDPVVNQTLNTITLITPAGTTAGQVATVTFAQVAGIENPDFAAVANIYIGYVNTGKDITPVASATYSAITTNVTFAPLLGPAGTPISVDGVGFSPSKSVDITDVNSVVIGTGTTTATGTFAVTAYAGPLSSGALTATDGDGNTNTTIAPYVFAVTPTLGLTPAAGLVLATVRVQGSAFTATNVLAITVGGVPVSVVTATLGALSPYVLNTTGYGVTGTGTFTGVLVPASTLIDITIAVPATMTGGLKAIDARVVNLAANLYANLAALLAITPAATGNFDVTPTAIALSSVTGIAGSQTTVTGTGFPAYQTSGAIALTTIAGAAVTSFIAPPLFTSGSDGQMTPRAITIPLGLAAGTYVVVATIGGASDTATFTIPQAGIPDIECAPNEGAVGSTFGITGSGFYPLTWATVTFTDTSSTPVVTLLGTVNTDSAGGITASGLTIPTSPPGFGTVTVTDSTALSASDTYEVATGAIVVLVADGMNTIAAYYERVVSWDNPNQAWLVYDPAIPALQTLASLAKKGSYWIKVTQDCTLTFGVETYDLYAPWSSIGWQG